MTITGKKQKFSVRDFVSEQWGVIRSKLHTLGFAVFENAKNNEVTLIHDVELAASQVVEGNYIGAESDALNAARVLLESHQPTDAQKEESLKPVVNSEVKVEEEKPADNSEVEEVEEKPSSPVVEKVEEEEKPASNPIL